MTLIRGAISGVLRKVSPRGTSTSTLLSVRPYSSHLMDVARFIPEPKSSNYFLIHKNPGACNENLRKLMPRAYHVSSLVGDPNITSPTAKAPDKLKDFGFSRKTLHLYPGCVPIFRNYSSSVANTSTKSVPHLISTSRATGDTSVSTSASNGDAWTDTLNQGYQIVADKVSKAGQMAKETTDELVPYVNQMMDSQPYLRDAIVPFAGTLSATLLAWFILPRFLRKLHNYSIRNPLALLLRSSSGEEISYQSSLWSAIEDPARYLLTFMAFSQLAVLLVPSGSAYLSQAWRSGAVLSFIWFLHRWKRNVITRSLSQQAITSLDRDKLLALDKISSVGLLALGVMASAEACGIAVQSILTVGGIGGVATAFAAKDIFGNVLNGLALQFTKPFSIGETIKAGSIEGQVVDIGLTTTLLINSEKFPVTVPNSMFSSQVIVNKSRAKWRAIIAKIPIKISDVEKIPLVSEDIKSVLGSYRKVFLEKEQPYCFLSKIENSYAELTIGCNVINMRKDELYATEQEILLEATKIIRKHGAELGSTLCEPNYQ